MEVSPRHVASTVPAPESVLLELIDRPAFTWTAGPESERRGAAHASMNGHKHCPRRGTYVAETQMDTVPAADRPMTYTWHEVWRGAWMAWALFVVLVHAAYFVIEAVEPPKGAFAAWAVFEAVVHLTAAVVVSAVVTVAMAPVARVIGRALRRVPNLAIHIAVFAALGAALGQLSVVLLNGAYGDTIFRRPQWSPFSVILPAGVALCAALGWAFTYWRSRRSKPRRPASPDVG